MKKLIILSLAVITFAACNEAAKPAPEANKAAAPQAAVAPAQPNQVAPAAQKDYTLPALKGASYEFTKNINKKPVVVAFMAGFCGWCKKMIPHMNDLAKQVPAKKADVIIAFMDATSNELVELEPVKEAKDIKIYYNATELMQEQGVNGFPTIMLFKDGKQVQAWRGYSPDHVASILQKLNEI